jgi:hypothetical protein
VLQSEQSLCETFEERDIRSHQNYFGHSWYDSSQTVNNNLTLPAGSSRRLTSA